MRSTRLSGPLAERGFAIEKEWEDGNGKFLQICDPEGNLLELMEPA